MFTGIDLFAGAGGLSLGAKWAGIETELAIEKEEGYASTYIYNHPNTKVIVEDIGNIDFSSIEVEPFILFGGPPCQGFSSSNTINRNLDNEKNHLFLEFVRAVKELNPYWVVFENVEGIKTLQKGIVIDWLKKEIAKLNYNYKIIDKVLTASEFGIPQNRNRYFLIANREGINFEFPSPVNFKVSVGDAIDDLPSLVNGQNDYSLPYKSKAISAYGKSMRKRKRNCLQNYVSRNANYVVERYQYIPQGGNWKDIPMHLMQNYKNRLNCHSGIYRRLCPKKPSCVISNYRKNMLIHPYEDRGLSVREAARLQSFPDDYLFQGPLEHIQQQIGNAVPPLLAKHVFDKILSYYEE